MAARKQTRMAERELSRLRELVKECEEGRIPPDFDETKRYWSDMALMLGDARWTDPAWASAENERARRRSPIESKRISEALAKAEAAIHRWEKELDERIAPYKKKARAFEGGIRKLEEEEINKSSHAPHIRALLAVTEKLKGHPECARAVIASFEGEESSEWEDSDFTSRMIIKGWIADLNEDLAAAEIMSAAKKLNRKLDEHDVEKALHYLGRLGTAIHKPPNRAEAARTLIKRIKEIHAEGNEYKVVRVACDYLYSEGEDAGLVGWTPDPTERREGLSREGIEARARIHVRKVLMRSDRSRRDEKACAVAILKNWMSAESARNRLKDKDIPLENEDLDT